MRKLIHVIGAGLTGATAAWYLNREIDCRIVVHEAQSQVGGQLRGSSLYGIPYELHGPHIFHTDSREAYEVANQFDAVDHYRHTVKTVSPRGIISWPPQVEELAGFDEWPVIERELADLPPVGERDSTNFETYAIDVMGKTLYDWLCYGYTKKQWGVEPEELSASFAPKRIDLRTDGYTALFRDRYQGFYRYGWHRLVENLLKEAKADIVLGEEVTLDTLPTEADAYVVTAPLDRFFLESDPLPWRGSSFTHHLVPTKNYDGHTGGQPAPVVNYPSADIPWTRKIDTSQMTRYRQQSGYTVLSAETPGADAKHYPVYDVDGVNRERAKTLQNELERLIPNVAVAGRLARYVYIDMDQAIIQGLNAARKIIRRFNGEEEE